MTEKLAYSQICGAKVGTSYKKRRLRQRHGPIAPVPVAKAPPDDEPLPVPAPRGKPQRNSKKLIDSYLQKTGDLPSGEPRKISAEVHQEEILEPRKSPEPEIEEESDIEESIVEEPEIEETLDNTSQTSEPRNPETELEQDSLEQPLEPVDDAIEGKV